MAFARPGASTYRLVSHGSKEKVYSLHIWVLHGLHIKAPKKEGLNLCSFPIVCQTESEFFLENEFKHFSVFNENISTCETDESLQWSPYVT